MSEDSEQLPIASDALPHAILSVVAGIGCYVVGFRGGVTDDHLHWWSMEVFYILLLCAGPLVGAGLLWPFRFAGIGAYLGFFTPIVVFVTYGTIKYWHWPQALLPAIIALLFGFAMALGVFSLVRTARQRRALSQSAIPENPSLAEPPPQFPPHMLAMSKEIGVKQRFRLKWRYVLPLGGLILALIVFGLPLTAEKPLPQPVSPVFITETQYYLDGGSISLKLHDSVGHVYYMFIQDHSGLYNGGESERWIIAHGKFGNRIIPRDSEDAKTLKRCLELAIQYRQEHREPNEDGKDRSLGIAKAALELFEHLDK